MNYSSGYFDFIGDNKFRFKSSNRYINFFFSINLLYQCVHRDQRFSTLQVGWNIQSILLRLITNTFRLIEGIRSQGNKMKFSRPRFVPMAEKLVQL